MLYIPKELDVTLSIISLNAYSYEIQKTANSSVFLTNECEKLAVIPFESKLEKPVSCPVLNGGYCITTMIDTAIKNSKTEWVFNVFAGTMLTKGLDNKYSKFVENYSDILFPVINRVWNFVDGSMNGLLINKKFHQEVGDFGKGNDLKLTKLIWADKVMTKGGKFKGIVGVNTL